MTASKKILLVLLPLFTLFVGWEIGINQSTVSGIERSGLSQAGSGTVVTGDPAKEVDLSLFWQVWRLLQQRYIAPGDLKLQPMLYGAISGMVRGVGDPFTVFMPPKENKDFHSTLQGTLEGIGAELTVKDGLVTVVSALKGSPAARAGVEAGDVIVKIDGAPIGTIPLDQVVDRIRGPKGTTVALVLMRKGSPAPLTMSIVREKIIVPTVESKILTLPSGQLGYVALNEFGDSSMQEIRTALASFKGKPIKGLILDLRYNGGGYLDGAVELASMFVEKGTIVTVQNRGGALDPHPASGSPLLPTIPLAILINQGTASASEIVAGALQDFHRATIIGMKSFGKGTVQEVIDLPGGSSLRVTIARWLTPNGKNLGKEGVRPDIALERDPGELANGKDSQLQAATDWLLFKKNDAKTASGSSVSSANLGK